MISSGSAMPGSTASTCAPSASSCAHRGGDRGGDLGMHVLRVAEGRREGDAQAADAVVEALQVVAVVVGQRGPVAGVGALQHVHHQRRVGDAHGVRAEVGDACPSARADRPARGRSSASGRSCRRSRPGCGRCRRRRCRPRAAPCRRRPPRRCRPTSRPASCSGFHGLRVMPVSGELVSPLQPNSGVVVLPRITAPASRSRAVAGASTSHGLLRIDGARAAQRRPALGEDQVLDRDRHAVEIAGRRAALPARLARRAPRAALRRARRRRTRSGPGSSRSMRASTARVASTGEASAAAIEGEQRRARCSRRGRWLRSSDAPDRERMPLASRRL